MALHKLEIPDDGSVLDLRADAVPPIDIAKSLYIQNVSNGDVNVGDSLGMAATFVCTKIGTSNSQMWIDPNAPVFVNTDNRRAILTIEST